jgi:hypothetical protein
MKDKPRKSRLGGLPLMTMKKNFSPCFCVIQRVPQAKKNRYMNCAKAPVMARKCEKSEKPFSAVLQRQPAILQAVPTKIAQNDFSDFSRNFRGYPGGRVPFKSCLFRKICVHLCPSVASASGGIEQTKSTQIIAITAARNHLNSHALA